MTRSNSLVVVCLVKAASNEQAGLERGGEKNRKRRDAAIQLPGGGRGKGRTSERSEAVLKHRRGEKKRGGSARTQCRLMWKRGRE